MRNLNNKFNPNWLYAVIQCEKKTAHKDGAFFPTNELFILKIICVVVTMHFNKILQQIEMGRVAERSINSKKSKLPFST